MSDPKTIAHSQELVGGGVVQRAPWLHALAMLVRVYSFAPSCNWLPWKTGELSGAGVSPPLAW